MAEPTLPTQQFVDIKEIKDGVIYLKQGGMRRLLIVSGVNFDLKSEPEQNMILGSFQNFLNTLDFSAQFFVHSRKVNVDAYLEKVMRRMEEETNQLLKIQIGEYAQFIRSFVEENAIINKTFFVIVPYDPIALPSSTSGLFGLFGKKTTTASENTALEEKLSQLSRRVTQVAEGLEQIGLRTAVLEDEELTELFYNLYNPGLVEKKGPDAAKK